MPVEVQKIQFFLRLPKDIHEVFRLYQKYEIPREFPNWLFRQISA